MLSKLQSKFTLIGFKPTDIKSCQNHPCFCLVFLLNLFLFCFIKKKSYSIFNKFILKWADNVLCYLSKAQGDIISTFFSKLLTDVRTSQCLQKTPPKKPKKQQIALKETKLKHTKSRKCSWCRKLCQWVIWKSQTRKHVWKIKSQDFMYLIHIQNPYEHLFNQSAELATSKEFKSRASSCRRVKEGSMLRGRKRLWTLSWNQTRFIFMVR